MSSGLLVRVQVNVDTRFSAVALKYLIPKNLTNPRSKPANMHSL